MIAVRRARKDSVPLHAGDATIPALFDKKSVTPHTGNGFAWSLARQVTSRGVIRDSASVVAFACQVVRHKSRWGHRSATLTRSAAESQQKKRLG